MTLLSKRLFLDLEWFRGGLLLEMEKSTRQIQPLAMEIRRCRGRLGVYDHGEQPA